MMKIPYTIVLGEKEIVSGAVTPRIRDDLKSGAEPTLSISDFIKKVSEESTARSRTSTL